MLDWISDRLLWIATSVPEVIVSRDSPSFMLVRAMWLLLLIVLILSIFSAQPFRLIVTRGIRKMASIFQHRP